GNVDGRYHGPAGDLARQRQHESVEAGGVGPGPPRPQARRPPRLPRIAERRLGDVHAGRQPAETPRNRPDHFDAAPLPGRAVPRIARQSRRGRRDAGTPPPRRRSVHLSDPDGQLGPAILRDAPRAADGSGVAGTEVNSNPPLTSAVSANPP